MISLGENKIWNLHPSLGQHDLGVTTGAEEIALVCSGWLGHIGLLGALSLHSVS